MPRPLLRIERALDRITRLAGGLSATAMAAMILLVFGNMVARYLFGTGAVWLQELEWYLLALTAMTGISYAMRSDEHVRVDVFSHRLNRIGRLWLDFFTMVAVALPVSGLILYYTWPFVATSYQLGETTPNANGMPWLFLPKAMILVGFGCIVLEALRQILSKGRRLVFHHRRRSGHAEGGPRHAA
ncbi:TRAP transporter small permease subunit [Ectothiorhodospira mobilis]|uniref:TRAP transporter small permease subunit n=1 Tax=Ectothiorhodospira mobilis TaxID=195064 RepID=UPI0019039245|nr:TRAP transporter small permease subunit [Ectothiorhodospira mobilis]MBK1692281.1 C4-dicarboxylate ABC transporter permease [Ectothiorhodospira mobilis]